MQTATAAPRFRAGPAGRVEYRLAREPGAVAQARNCAASTAERLLAPQRIDDLRLAISEVVTNAVRHGGTDPGGEIVLAMTPKDDFLCVQVTDGGGGFVPTPRAMVSDDTGGFGLFLVERLTRRWGMTREQGRTRVWFELDYQPAASS